MSYLKKDMEELKPWVEKTVQKFLGFSEPALVTASMNCIVNGFDRRKTTDKLRALLDESKSLKFTDRLFDGYDGIKIRNASSTKKRSKEEPDYPKEKKAKKVSEVEKVAVPAGNPSPGQLSALQIREMMANAQKAIEQRKQALNQINFPPSGVGKDANQFDASQTDKARQIAELQAKIQSRLANKQDLLSSLGNVADLPSKPTPLILDDKGRTVDVTGREIQLTHRMPTLKANIRAVKREQYKVTQEKVVDESEEANYFDSRVNNKVPVRNRRQFVFHEKGKFESLAQRIRAKAQLDKLQDEIAQAAKKTGISSATKLALIAPKTDLLKGEVPAIEWWDSVILKNESFEKFNEDLIEGITHLIEHPTQMKAPTESTRPITFPVMLTKKEQKKLRRQNRREAWKDKQERIRIGIDPPPEPKMKLSNMMRVLGTDAVQDPTKIEAHVRAQMAKRQKAHEETNAARKLTDEQRRDKKIKKLKEDTSLGVHVSIYRIKSLANPSKKFKVETNANQLYMTGCVVLYRDVNLVVVEGGPKQQKKLRRLMMHRIKWSEDPASNDKNDDGERNKCELVWEGTKKSRSFSGVKFKVCPTENLAKEHFRKHGVSHYWDFAYSHSILEADEDD